MTALSRHESWFTVATLTPRLRAQVQVVRQRFRGATWHVLRDPATQRSFRLSDASWRFIGLLDGRRTVQQALDIAQNQLGDAAPMQGEALALLGQLSNANLLDARLTGDAAELHERRQQRRTRERRGKWASALFFKIPLWDPDALLERAEPVLGRAFTGRAFGLWALLLIAGFLSIAGRWDELGQESGAVLAPANLPALYLVIIGTKLIHELSHGLAAKHFARIEGRGGEVHTIGIMLMALLPVPYVDTSAAWAFRSKWRRAIVGAAGMYAELAIAALAAIIWARTAGDTLAHALAYNAVLAAGISTILFNANPLVRFDGYFIATDLAEMPNLMQRSRDQLLYLIKRHLLGAHQVTAPGGSRGEARLLTIYGLLSTAYRTALIATIVLFVAGQLFFIGVVLALIALVTIIGLPIGRAIGYLARSPEIDRVRSRALLTTAGPAAALLLFFGLVPLPDRARAEGVAEPKAMEIVHAGSDGFLTWLRPSGTRLHPRVTPVAALANDDLAMRRRWLTARLRELDVRSRMALTSDIAALRPIKAEIQATRQELDQTDAQLRGMLIRAPLGGRWLVAGDERPIGRFVHRGERIGLVIANDALRIRAATDQIAGPRLTDALQPGTPVAFRAKSRLGEILHGRVSRLVSSGRRELPTAALSMPQGGRLSVDTRIEGSLRTTEPYFEIWIDPDRAAAARLHPGELVIIRFDAGRAPLLRQGWRSLRQLFQERFQI